MIVAGRLGESYPWPGRGWHGAWHQKAFEENTRDICTLVWVGTGRARWLQLWGQWGQRVRVGVSSGMVGARERALGSLLGARGRTGLP